MSYLTKSNHYRLSESSGSRPGLFIAVLAVLFFITPCTSHRFSLQAQPVVDSLTHKLSSAKGKDKVDLLNKLAYYTQRESVPLSRNYAYEALSLSKQIQYPGGQAAALRNVGLCYYIYNELNKAMDCFQQSLNISNSLHEKKESSATLNCIGLIYWKKGNFTSAFDYYRKSLKLSRQSGLEIEAAKSLNYIGLIYWKWSDLANSLDYFMRSLKLKEKLKDDLEIAITLNNVANIYNELGNFNESLKYSSRAYRMASRTNDLYSLGRALNNMGVSYFRLNNFRKAEEIQLTSLKITQTAGDKVGTGYSLFNLGNIYYALKNYQKAIDYYGWSLKLRKEIHDNYGTASLLISIAKTHIQRSEYDKADRALLESKALSEREGLKDLLKNIFLIYSELNEAEGNYTKALDYYKRYSTLKDSVFTKDFGTKIAELQVSYEFDAKEKEIELLTQEKKIQELKLREQRSRNNALFIVILFGFFLCLALVFRYNLTRKTKKLLEAKNAEIALRNAELSEVNAAKDKFFSIIAHDLKSPFNGLLGYTEIIIEDFEELKREELRQFLLNIRAMTKGVFGLIENLLTWSRMQTGRMEFVPEKIDLYSKTERIVGVLTGNAIRKDIKIRNEMHPDTYAYGDKNMVYSVMTNLLSNALKFTPPGGEIKINSKNEENGFVRISVTDTGVGISEQDLKKLFKIDQQHTTEGTDQEKGTGLGLVLCKELIEKNGGQIQVCSEVSKGSTFSFTLPVN